eukprot:303631_1
MCFDVVLVEQEGNELRIGRIMKIYQSGAGVDDDTAYISLKWYERSKSDDTKLIFNAYDTTCNPIAISNIKSKAIVFDTQAMMEEHKDDLPVFYCEEYYALNKETVLKVTDDAYNTSYWNQQKQSESDRFEAYSYDRRHSLNTVTTSSTASILDQYPIHPFTPSQQLNMNQNQNENTKHNRSQLQFVSSPNLSDSDESDNDDESTTMVRDSHSTFNRNINPRKRLLSQLSQLEMDAPPPKRRRRQLSSSLSLSSSSLLSSASSCKTYVKLLKTEIKLLSKSLSDKDSVIHQTNSLFGHFDKLIQQKDGIIQQKK